MRVPAREQRRVPSPKATGPLGHGSANHGDGDWLIKVIYLTLLSTQGTDGSACGSLRRSYRLVVVSSQVTVMSCE